MKYSALLAVIISCIGLFGLVSFDTRLKTKEMGIRKVCGASSSDIVQLLSKDYIKWVFMANLIAWPTAFYVIDRWLQNFVYHTKITYWIFAVSGLIVFFTILIAVSYQIIKVSLLSPVDSLKY